MDRFISTVKKVSQVAKLPARVTVNEQDVRPVIGDGNFEVPGIIVDKLFRDIGFKHELVVIDPFCFR